MSRTRKLALAALVLAAVVSTVGLIVARQQPSPPAADRGLAAAPPAEPVSGALEADTFRTIAEHGMPMVVSIRTVATAESPAAPLFGGNDALRRFFGMPDVPTERRIEGAGSGFIIDPSGLVLTNNHVVAGATSIKVALFPDPKANPGSVRQLDARVLGRDPLTDSALLQITEHEQLPVASLGNSDDMHPGDWVLAIGNPFALSHTVTVGVISAVSRPFPMEGRTQRVLQTDAAVNPGNSGGPLLNLRGEVIGMNTAIVSPSGTGGNVGIGFAVPINLVRDLVPRLEQGDIRRARLGVEIRDVPAQAAEPLGLTSAAGALVATVEPDGPADEAGLRPGDVIVRFEDEPVDTADELVHLVSDAPPGRTVTIRVMRDGTAQNVPVTLGELQFESTETPGRPVTASLGLELGPITPRARERVGLDADRGGALVTAVEPGSPAASSGIQPGDVIVEVDRSAVRSVDETVDRLRQTGPGQAALLLLWRDGRQVFVPVVKPD